jgi:hypothetical protein
MRFLITLSLIGLLAPGVVHSQTNEQTIEPETTLPVSDVQEISWEDVPLPVQHTFKSHSRGGEISDVRKATLRGHPVYLGTFTAEESTIQMAVKKDGSLMAGESSRTADLAAQTSAPNIDTNAALATPPTAEGTIAGGDAAGATPTAPDATFAAAAARAAATTPKLNWEQLPAAVQHSFSTQTDSGQVQDITTGTIDGRPVYDITYRDGDQNSQVRVTATGEIMNRVIVSEGAGASLAAQPVSLDQLPINVLATVSAATDGAPVMSIEQNTVNGQNIYSVTVMQNGQPVQIRVRQDGQVVP